MARESKQVIVLRNDLDMPPGKAASQAAHASIAWLSDRLAFRLVARSDWAVPYESMSAYFSESEVAWMDGSFTKIVLQATLEDMLHVYYEAKDADLTACLIVDEGRTVFKGIPTPTALAIGPDWPEKIDVYTGSLKLYR